LSLFVLPYFAAGAAGAAGVAAGASVIFAVVIGMAAGYFPSKRAMKLSPLAAIRNE